MFIATPHKILHLACLFFILLTLLTTAFAQSNIEFSIKGIEDEEIVENIKTRLQVDKNYFQNIPSKNQLNDFYQRIDENIRKAIEPFGYFHSTIRTDLEQKRNKTLVISNINLGLPTRISQFSIKLSGEGANEKKLLQIINSAPIKKGMHFHTRVYLEFKDKLINWATENGFLHADFRNSTAVYIDKDTNSCIINIHFDTKEQYFFGETSINAVNLDGKFINRYLQYKTYEPFSSTKLMKTYNVLSSSKYFDKVNITPIFDNINNYQIPIDIMLQLRKRVTLQAGFGYGTDSGLETFANIILRRVNRQGHKLQASFDLAETNRTIDLDYVVPGRNPVTDETRYNFTGRNIDIPAGKSQNIQTGIFLSSSFKTWNRTISLSYLIESFILSNQNKWNTKKLLIPQISLNNRYINNDLFPTKASKIQLKLLGSKKDILSTDTFLQASLSYDVIFTMYNFRFISKSKVGTTFISNIKDLPLSLQFLEGGPFSIRGYANQTIPFSSDLKNHPAQPGRHLLKTSLDIQIPIFKNFYIGPFFDVGNVFNNINEKMRTSTGFNIIYKSKIGPISVGIAKAFQRDATEKFRLLFNIGPEI